ncbi:MAG: hypothetical protein GY812_04550 [Actinomycetia bacterium]|nr:hypothetical protein [Actinomycetes bacterium]
MTKGTPTTSRTAKAAAQQRANRMAALQWWLIAAVLVAGLVLAVVFFSADGTGVPTHAGALSAG